MSQTTVRARPTIQPRIGNLQVGRLRISLQRTERVLDNNVEHGLPPGLGALPIFAAADYQGYTPAGWEPNAIFAPIRDTEAIYMGFSRAVDNYHPWITGWQNQWTRQPVAAVIGAGGVNCLTGEKLATALVKDGYVVVPPQIWLDGWKASTGEKIYQFVATKHQQGEGKTVGEQLIGAESKTGAIGIATYDPAPGSNLPEVASPSYYGSNNLSGKAYKSFNPSGAGGQSAGGNLESLGFDEEAVVYAAAAGAADPQTRGLLRSASARPMQEMGLGRGGSIKQKIYPDPYGLDKWAAAPSARVALYLVSAEDFAQITGTQLHEVAIQERDSRFFTVIDGHLADVAGTEKFDKLETVQSVVGGSAAFPGD